MSRAVSLRGKALQEFMKLAHSPGDPWPLRGGEPSQEPNCSPDQDASVAAAREAYASDPETMDEFEALLKEVVAIPCINKAQGDLPGRVRALRKALVTLEHRDGVKIDLESADPVAWTGKMPPVLPLFTCEQLSNLRDCCVIPTQRAAHLAESFEKSHPNELDRLVLDRLANHQGPIVTFHPFALDTASDAGAEVWMADLRDQDIVLRKLDSCPLWANLSGVLSPSEFWSCNMDVIEEWMAGE